MNKQEKMQDIKEGLQDVINMSDEFNKYDLLVTAIRYNEESNYQLSIDELKNIIQSLEFELQLFELGFNKNGYIFSMDANGQYIEYNTFYNNLYIQNVDDIQTRNINTIREYVNYYKK